MHTRTDHVKKRVLLFLVLQIFASLSITVNVRRNSPNITAKKKIQLVSVHVACFLNDIIRLSAPMVHENDLYYLSKPNGESYKLDLHAPKQLNINRTKYYHDRAIAIAFLDKSTGVVNQEDMFSAFKADEFEEKLSDLEPNEFMVGPLLEEDYGNWVLTTYTRTLDGEWIELFQVFTMAITEYTILDPQEPKLRPGDTFNLSFPFLYPGIETCEVVAPRTTYDRFFNRTMNEFNKCGFSVPNITKKDEGEWKIIGFGRIVYQGEVFLKVEEPPLPTELITEEDNLTDFSN